MKFDKITVFNDIVDVINNKPYKPFVPFVPIFPNKIIVGEYKTIYGYGVVRVWNNQRFGFGQISRNNTVGALDYQIHDTIFKIEDIYVYDRYSGSLELNSNKEAKKYINLMVKIAEKKSNDLLFDKMIMDTHMNLFNRYYENEGFTLTGKVASDNESCVEMMRMNTNTNENQHNL